MKEFYINDDGIRLHAKLDMPEGREKCPLVIIIHGLTGHMEERHIIAFQETVNEIGFASLRVEMYGHGQSEGAFRDHTLLKWIGNAMKVIDYAKTLDFVTDLYLGGHSQGGLLTVLAAGMRPDDFKAILPLSPALMIPEDARQGRLLGGGFDPDHIAGDFPFNDMVLDANYLRAAQLLYPKESIRKYHGPVLITHGDEDEAVPLKYSVEAAELFDDCRLVVIGGDDHCYDLHLDQVTDAIREFLLEMDQ